MINTCTCHGAATTPTEILMQEHRVIETVLDAIEHVLARGSIEQSFFEKAVDFFRNFADGCHHAKEEDALFPVLERAGVPREGGPIGCMLAEHELGRRLLKQVADNLGAACRGNGGAERTLRRAAGEYVVMLRQHIAKEDNVLFVMADNALNTDEQQAVASAMVQMEQHGDDPEKHERYVRLAKELVSESNSLCLATS